MTEIQSKTDTKSKGQTKIYYATNKSASEKGYIKIGETKYVDVNRRMDELSRATGVYDPFYLVKEFYADDLIKKLNKSSNLDKVFHKHLMKQVDVHGNPKYPRVNDKREFFKISVEEADSEWNNLLYGINRLYKFPVRSEQKEAVDMTYDYFSNDNYTFLWNCKCGFGKCFTTYQLIKRFNRPMNVLILTSKPSVEDSWKSDMENHIDFVNFNYNYIRDEKVELVADEVNIVFGSFQDAIGKTDEDEMKDKWKSLLKNKFDLLVVDEGHYGAFTENAINFIKKVDHKHKLLLSATPMKMLLSGDFDYQNTYTFTYVDAQLMKRNYPDNDAYKWMPTMNMFTMDIGSRLGDDMVHYKNEENGTLNKFFGSDDGEKFNNQSAVYKFLDLLATEDSKVFSSPFNLDITAGKLNHTFWFLNSVNSVMAMKKVLNNHYFFKKYRVIAAAGDNDNEGNDTIQLVRDCIYKNPLTITLSCGKLNTGITIKQWDGVLMLDDTVSAESYWQTAFRVERQDSSANKTDCFVFDFNPNRFLKVTYDYCQATAKKGQSTSSSIRSFLDTMKVLSYSDNKLVKIDPDNFEKIIIQSIDIDSLSQKYSSDRMVNPYVDLSDESIDILNNIFSNSSKKVLVTKVTSSYYKNGKNFANNGNGSKMGQRTMKNEIRERINKVIEITRHIPTFLYLSDNPTVKIESVENIINHGNTDLFKEVVGIELYQFDQLVKEKLINVSFLNKAIESFKCFSKV